MDVSFFNLLGYVLSTKWISLGVRKNEHLVMLSSIIQSVFIDVD